MRSALDQRPHAVRLHLPAELSFLISPLYPAALLGQVAEEAHELGVSPESHFIAAGYCSQRRYYEALAHALGLCFLDDVRLQAGVPVQDLARCSVGQTCEGELFDYVIAPRGGEIAALLAMKSLSESFARVAITTPALLEHALRRANAVALASAAADEFPGAAPSLSARARPLRSELLAALACAVFVSALWFHWPVVTVFILNLFVANVVILQSTLRIAATLGSGAKILRRRAKPLRDSELPFYSVLVPLYREARVLPSLLRAIEALDYPRAKLEVVLLVEECDVETIAVLLSTRFPPHVRVVSCLMGSRGQNLAR